MGLTCECDRARKHQSPGVVADGDSNVARLSAGIRQRNGCYKGACVVEWENVGIRISILEGHTNLLVAGPDIRAEDADSTDRSIREQLRPPHDGNRTRPGALDHKY